MRDGSSPSQHCTALVSLHGIARYVCSSLMPPRFSTPLRGSCDATRARHRGNAQGFVPALRRYNRRRGDSPISPPPEVLRGILLYYAWLCWVGYIIFIFLSASYLLGGLGSFYFLKHFGVRQSLNSVWGFALWTLDPSPSPPLGFPLFPGVGPVGFRVSFFWTLDPSPSPPLGFLLFPWVGPVGFRVSFFLVLARPPPLT